MAKRQRATSKAGSGSIRSQPDPQTVTRERNRRAVRIFERDPSGVLEAALRVDVMEALTDAGAPAALLGSLAQAASAPAKWRGLPVWQRGERGLQAMITRVRFGGRDAPVSVLVRAGDPE